MTLFTRVFVLSIALLSGQFAFAARLVQFTGNGNHAQLSSQVLLLNRSDVAGVDLHLSVPGVSIDRQDDGFDKLEVTGLYVSQTWGSPEVLGTGSLVAVPAGYNPVLEVLQIDEREVDGVRVRPAQKHYRCNGPREVFAFNSSLYSENTTYPNEIVKLEEVGKLGSVRLVRVALQPVRMEMMNQKLRIATDVHVQVRFEKTAQRVAPEKLPRTLLRTLRASTVNGRALGTTLSAEAGPEHMLVLVADNLKSALEPFKEWKQSKGLVVDEVTLTEAGGTKEAMQTFIKDYYQKASVKPTYLLFVGNKETMPAFKESTGSGSAASDYRMALLGTDESIPNVFYGRLVADNEEELAAEITRVMEYEKSPAKADWYHDAITIASNEGDSPSDAEYTQQISDALSKGTFKTVDRFLQGEETATADNITGALAKGRSWISYIGHGSGTSWGSVNDTFNVATVSKLDNTGKLPVIIDVACLNASWMNLSKCFGKAWVTQKSADSNAGAVAFYGGSVSISWHPPAVMSVGIAKSHFEKSVTTLGAATMAGQLYLIEKMGTGSDVTDNLKWYNLLGDPSLVMRTDTPKELRIKQTVGTRDNRTSIRIEASDLSGTAVSGLLAAVSSKDRGTLGVAKTDASGKAEIIIDGLTASPTADNKLTVTGYNTETYQALLN